MTHRSDNLDQLHETPERLWLHAKKKFAVVQDLLKKLPPDLQAKLQGSFAQKLLDNTFAVDTPRGPLSFVLLGKTAAGRASTLLTKQPDTITWIESFRPNSVFWDIGANVGVYALYAALALDIRVVAFEPAAVNYFLLSANCEANDLNDRVDCLLMGVGGRGGVSRFEVSQFESAKSFSFRVNADRSQRTRQAALVLSMDQLVEEFELPCPNYIKVDVPAMTEDVIAGGERMLRRSEVRELHIEMREESAAGRRIVEFLDRSGFAIAMRHHHGASADITFARR